MVKYIIALIIVNLTVFGGGGVYIPVYQTVFVQWFKLFSIEAYSNIIVICNLIPGVLGAKLASYLFTIEYGIGGFIVGSIVFLIIPITLIIVVYRFIDKIKNHPLYLNINRSLQPVLIAMFIVIGIRFFKTGSNDLAPIISISYFIISLLIQHFTKINLGILLIIGIVINAVLFL